MLKRNFDYAGSLLLQIVTLKPDHGEAFALLCETFQRRAERKPTPRWLARLGAAPYQLSASLAKLGRNPAGRVRALTRCLRLEPTSEPVAMALGEALAESGHMNSAVATFRSCATANPRSSAAWKAAATCHARLKEVDQALESLEKALQINPKDAEAERMRKNLTADVTLQAGAYENAQSSRDLIRDRNQAQQLELDQRIHRTGDEIVSELEELKQQLDSDPKDRRARRRIAKILARQGEFEEAIAVLEASRSFEDQVADLDDRVGDLRIEAQKAEVAQLAELQERSPHPDRARDLEQLEKDLGGLEISEYRRRLKDRPTELGLWHALGKALQDAGELDEAIEAFQRSVKDPKVRLDSLVRLGGCFHRKGLFDLAEKQLTAALEETSATGERGKAILYNLGLVCEKAGREEEAFRYYSRVYEVDIRYRDVAQRIETLRPR